MDFRKFLICISIITILILGIFLLNIKYKWFNTDIIEFKSVSSFNAIINKIATVEEDDQNGLYILKSPDNQANLIWNKNYNNGNTYNLMMNFDIRPFINAGLDINKIKDIDGIEIIGNSILYGSKYNNVGYNFKNNLTEIDSFRQIIDSKRDDLSYHSSLEHFGIEILHGNSFEWAQDIDKNDKDIVFVLDPEILINAGVNPNYIEGWTYTKIEKMDNSGKKIEVNKLLKAFNLK